MEKNSKSKLEKILQEFRANYDAEISAHGFDPKSYDKLFEDFYTLVKKQLASPFVFEPFHQMIRHPYDYYQFGVDLFRPLVDESTSTLLGRENLRKIETELKQGQNVIFLANHQIEADPLAISILLEKEHPHLATAMIFVAGERVITDPLAVPFSMGRNLLCIYSKRYIDNPPQLKAEKQLHNKRTMELMSNLLKEGGKCIYVAPSGGRDRKGPSGKIEVAPFDGSSIEMLYLMAQRAHTPTHFYPMALSTYDLLPPPETIQTQLGEARVTKRGSIHISVGDKIDMEKFPGFETASKHAKRQARADYIWGLVDSDYKKLGGSS